MKTGCEFVKCVLLVNGKCVSKANTCEYRTDEERVEELESMVDGLHAKNKRLKEQVEYWQQAYKNRGGEIVDKSHPDDIDPEYEAMRADLMP